MVVVVSRLSDRLVEAKKAGGWTNDQIVDRARRLGHQIDRSAVSRYLAGAHGSAPRESTLAALAAGLGVDVRELRSLAGRPAGELGPYVPTPLAASLTRRQRDALDVLIKAFVSEEEVGDVGNPRQKSIELGEALRNLEDPPSNVHQLPRAARTIEGGGRGKRLKEEADRLGEESQDPDDWND